MQCHTKQKHTSVTIQKLNQASKYTMQPVCICRKGEKLSYPALEINFMMGARDTKQLFFFFAMMQHNAHLLLVSTQLEINLIIMLLYCPRI